MPSRKPTTTDETEDMLLTAYEVGEMLGVSHRTVLALPLERVTLGPRLIRFRRSDVLRFFGLDEQ